MPASVTFTLTLAPLPINFNGTPQQFGDALVNRITITPSTPWSSFITGSVVPTSDNGPLLFNAGSGNKEWRVWDTGLGAYTYLVVNGAGIVAGTIPLAALATDNSTAKTVFIRDASGVPALVGGTVSQLLTMTSGGPAFATPAPFVASPARALNAINQTLPIDANLHQVNATSVQFDPNSCYDSSGSDYVAPATGYYFVSARYQADNSGGTASAMEIAFGTAVNGNSVLAGRVASGTSVPTPPGMRWYPQLCGLVALNAGDTLTIYTSANDGVLAGSLILSNVQFNIYRVQ